MEEQEQQEQEQEQDSLMYWANSLARSTVASFERMTPAPLPSLITTTRGSSCRISTCSIWLHLTSYTATVRFYIIIEKFPFVH